MSDTPDRHIEGGNLAHWLADVQSVPYPASDVNLASYRRQVEAAREQDRVTLTTRGEHGRRNLWTFELSRPDAANQRHWLAATPLTAEQAVEVARRRRDGADFAEAAVGMMTQRQGPLGLSGGRIAEHDAALHLAAGFDISPQVLCVILDALHAASRRHVDIGDVKTVVSQLGSRCAMLAQLDDETRRRAAPALCAQILARCTTV